ncbi:hypothetical protein SAMN02746041_00443 [Desulfacinum hydrothermale DSM 13146]|uniref:Uncharacterized protein n=1 Tax=Desulfacinum hydrothermale DSM 13146 TaxID=1121390 RepID=A0A1W1X249_9BACT|nr:hypothetical protein [Desulfacinum hydrothermale]SMC18012.1 hypothetical protein SAMN02746041_00443 [Desulfacinum hydrothermale DSM 13146]
MYAQPALDWLRQLAAEHLTSLLVCALTLAVVGVVVVLRWWLRRRWHALLQESAVDGFQLGDPEKLTPQDRQALECLKRMRREILHVPESQLSITFESLFQRSQHVVRTIARIYHPDEEEAEYQASLDGLLQLTQRVTGRLLAVAAYGPFRLLASRRLAHYRSLYRSYQTVQENRLVQGLRRHKRIYKVARMFWNLRNIKNPFYWLGKELSQEGYFLMLRWFHVTLVNQVGKEAIRLYSAQPFIHNEERDLALACFKVFSQCERDATLDAPGLKRWISFVCRLPVLDASSKLKLIQQACSGSLPPEMEGEDLRTSRGKKWYRKGLEHVHGKDAE